MDYETELENQEELRRIPKTKHLRISRRDTMVNDLRNSTVEGLLSFVFSLISVAILGIAVYLSYRSGGNGDIRVGILAFLSLLLSIAALILSVFGFRIRSKVRHYMERRGLVISAATIAVLIYFFVKGLILFLR